MIRYLFFVCFLSAGMLAAQQKNDLSSYKHYADSIVRAYTGSKVFETLIRFDSSQSAYLGNSQATSLRSQLTFTPDRLRFHYWLYHPKLREKFPIVFTIDTNYRFVDDPNTHGLIDIRNVSDPAIVSRKQAIQMCRDQAVSIRRKTTKLVWHDGHLNFHVYNKTNDPDALWSGSIAWAIKGKIEFRSNIYSGTFYVNVLTGAITRGFAVPWD